MAEQKRTGPDWEDVRLFVALVRHGSLSATARALGVNHATVARRIRSLEAALGQRLVERRPDGYILTPAGTRALAAASDMEAAAMLLGRAEEEHTPKGLVRVNAPPALAHGFLLARLAKLPAQHPGLVLDVATDLRSVSLERRETDIAIRVGRLRDSDLIARHVATMGYGFYATANMLQRLAGKGEPVFVGFDEKNSDLPEAVWLARRLPMARICFRANDHIGQAAAAKANAGIALLPHYIGRFEPALQMWPFRATPPSREVWLLRRRQDRKDEAIQTVADFITQVFSRERDLFDVPSNGSRGRAK